MGGAADRQHDAFAEINVTPLVDVMLVLLAIFMITAPLLTAGLRVDLPREHAPPSALEHDSAIVTIAVDGSILLDGRDIRDDVEGALRSDARIADSGQIWIEADADARYSDIARVVAAARAVGVSGLNLLVEPREEAHG